MQSSPLTVRASPTLGSVEVACIVQSLSEPACPAEVAAKARGAHVTRLDESQLLSKAVDSATLHLLGKLYDELIVPDSWAESAPTMATTAGIPVVCRGQFLLGN